ncbi:MAG: hypothetical protein ABEJ95_02900 [Candidatus Nanohalobium sp.]
MSLSENQCNTVFLNHFHTKESTYHERLRDFTAVNHHGSPAKIAEELDEGQKAAIVVTEHFSTNGEDWYKELGRDIERDGGNYTLNENSLNLEQGGSEVTVWNGVEASYKDNQNHIIAAGLPINDEEDYLNLNSDDMEWLADRSDYIHPAHPYFMDFGMEEDIIEDVIDIGQDSEAQLFLPETHAYGVLDSMATGEVGSDTSVYDLSREEDIPLIPEQDHHVHLPHNLSGVGLIPGGDSDEITDRVEEVQVIEPENSIQSILEEAIDTKNAVRTFADMLPGYNQEDGGVWKHVPDLGPFSIPVTDEDFEDIRDSSYRAALDFDISELQSRSRPLN